MAEATSTLIAPAANEAPTEQPRPLGEPGKPDKGGFIWGTGRRKSAVARVRVRPIPTGGSAKFLIKGREVDDFFSEPQHRAACRKPLEVTGMIGKLEIFVNTHGGGITGQAEAVLLGVARALKSYDPTLEQALRDEGLLTRDPREVERKKYGQAGARKRFQFSKR